jgi:hypothetical protein
VIEILEGAPLDALYRYLVDVEAVMRAMVEWHQRRHPPRGEPMGLTGYDWHGCMVAHCGTLIRPREPMCPRHLAQVPVPLRMMIKRLSPRFVNGEDTRAWRSKVADAIILIEMEEGA